MRAGLGAVAVAHAAVLFRQFGVFEHLSGEHSAERDLGRGDEAHVPLGDAVDLCFRPAGDITDALQDLVLRQVGRDGRREALGQQQVESVSLQRQLQQHGLVLQKVKAVAGDPGPRLEVDQVERLGQFDVVERFEVERRRLVLALEHLAAIVLAAHRHVGVREVRDHPLQVEDFRVEFVVGALLGVLLFAQAASFFLAGLALGGVLRLADRLAHLVRLPVQLLDLLRNRLAPRFHFNQLIDVDVRTTAGAVFLDQVDVFQNELAIEHGWIPNGWSDSTGLRRVRGNVQSVPRLHFGLVLSVMPRVAWVACPAVHER